jgi:hypothetical protein
MDYIQNTNTKYKIQNTNTKYKMVDLAYRKYKKVGL